MLPTNELKYQFCLFKKSYDAFLRFKNKFLLKYENYEYSIGITEHTDTCQAVYTDTRQVVVCPGTYIKLVPWA